MPEALRDQVFEFSVRDPASLRAILSAHEVAAVILAPEMMWPPDKQTFTELIELTRRLAQCSSSTRSRPRFERHPEPCNDASASSRISRP